MNNKNLNRVRNKIDKVDLKILNLIKSRTQLVTKIIKLKKTKNQIVDNSRIKNVLKKIKIKSIKKKIDPKITNKIWKSMIKSYIDYEKKNFDKK